jgi:hypothetical protein
LSYGKSSNEPVVKQKVVELKERQKSC